MAETLPQIVTGDDWMQPVTLYANDANGDSVIFPVDLAASVEASIITKDATPVSLIGPIVCLSGTTGADWPNGIVVPIFTTGDTVALIGYRYVQLEIQVNFNGRSSWFGLLQVVEGTIP